MTAMYYALKRALRRPPGEEHTHIRSDSLYTINMTTGKWIPRTKRNREFVSTLRGMWRDVQRRRPREVTLQHVRSHIKIPGNELADWLADLRLSANAAAATRWLRNWVRGVGTPTTQQSEAMDTSTAGNSGSHIPSTLGDPEGVG